MSRRVQRVSSEMQKELSRIIRELKDPRVNSMVSVMEVEVGSDLSVAKVFVSIYGGDQSEKDETLEGLKASAGYIRKELARAFKAMHHVPEVRFELDTSMDYAQKINNMLEDITYSTLEEEIK